jgi:hypothetical protein
MQIRVELEIKERKIKASGEEEQSAREKSQELDITATQL